MADRKQRQQQTVDPEGFYMQYVSTIPCFTLLLLIKVARVSFSRRGHKFFTHFAFNNELSRSPSSQSWHLCIWLNAVVG